MKGVHLDENCLRLPLRPVQQSLWFLDRLGAGKAYNVSIAIRLIGELDIAALEKSLNEIIRRHESLRAFFPLLDGSAIQAIRPQLTLSLPITSLEDVPAGDRERRTRKFIAAQARQTFNLAEDTLIRTLLLRPGDEEHILVAVMPEIVCDPWSLKLLLQELAAFYKGFCSESAPAVEPLSNKYSELVALENKRLESAIRLQLSFWKENLRNSSLLQMPTDRTRSSLQSFNGAARSLRLSEDLTARLRELSRREEATLFVTLLAAFQTLLHRYTGQHDIAAGSPVDTRSRAGAEGLIGCFVNTLVMRGDLSGDPTCRELLGRARRVVSDAYDHQDVPFAMLVQELKIERSPGSNPLFQVMFVLYQALEAIQATPDLRMVPVNVASETAEFYVTLYVQETENELELICEYDTDLFDEDTVGRMLGHLSTLLTAAVTDADQRLSVLPILTDVERFQIIDQWNDNEIAYPEILSFNELFELQAEQRPDAIAAAFEDCQVTYLELNAQANQLAHHLISLGCGPEMPVAVFVEPSLHAVTAILAILKAGAVYLPLDPSNPPASLSLILDDAQPSIILTQRSLRGLLPGSDCHVISLDESSAGLAAERIDNPPSRTTAEDLCAIFFTSGSTGRPKGVMTPHRTPLSRLFWVRDIWTLTEGDRLFLHEGVVYASSITQMFLPSATGAQLVIGRPGAVDIDNIINTIGEKKITLVGFTPSVLRIILMEQGRFPNCLRHVFCSAEALPNEVQSLFFNTMSAELHKFYGLTEAPGVACWHCSPEDHWPGITIGRPSDMKVYLVDSNLQPVPVGIPGEIYTGGISLTRGYLNRPDLTAERYIPDPFSGAAGARLYTTGDLARWLPNGQIEFLGRVDHQVNVLGHRVELGEIEAALGQHRRVQQAAVALSSDGSGQPTLVAYLVANGEDSIGGKEMKDFLKDRLPDHKTPSVYVFLKSMPKLPNGKINRLELASFAVNRSDDGRSFVAPRNDVEAVVAGIWAELLGVEQVGVYDSFFELGGNSLLGVQMIHRASSALQIELPVRTLFEAPTVAGMAEHIERHREQSGMD